MIKRVFVILFFCAVTAFPAWGANAGAPADPAWNRIVSADLKDKPLADAVSVLFSGTDWKCELTPVAESLRVTAVLKNVSTWVALQEVLRAAGARSAVRDKTVYIYTGDLPLETPDILFLERNLARLQEDLGEKMKTMAEDDPDRIGYEHQIEAAQETLNSRWDSAWFQMIRDRRKPEVTSAQTEKTNTQVFTILYINPAELVPMLYAVGATQVTVAGENRLVISGTDEALKKAGDVIASVDREESLPRPVRLKLTVNVRSEQKGGEPFDCSISCDGTGAEGQMIQPNLSVKLPVGKTGDTAEVFLNSTITPTITPDGKIALRGSGNFKCTPSGEVSRTFDVAAVVQPGKPQIISEGSADVGTGKVSFSVDIVATIGEGRLRTPTSDTPRRW